uniref:SH3 domain-containing protein n=1 Tax=Syphacia muris TaxID=451379 RepID=A0A0N5AS15_9BILA
MEYNRPYRCYNQCFSRPELEIGSRLEVVVIGKNWDNYIIKSSQNGADYFGVIYLGRWVREPQPPYSSRVPDFQQRNIFGTYSNGVVPYSSTNKVARQKEMIESQQQRFGELSNGCEKQTINHVAPQGREKVNAFSKNRTNNGKMELVHIVTA